MIVDNINNLQNKMKDDLKKTNLKDSLTKSKMILILNSDMSDRVTIRSEKMTKILREQTSFYLGIVEVMRRELVSYEITLSNLTNSTRTKLGELRFVTEYIKDLLEKSVKGAATKDDTESLTNVNHVKGDAEGLAEVDHAKGIVEMDNVKGIEGETLSGVFLKALGVHECRCPACDPEYHQDMEDKAKAEAKQTYNSSK